MAVILYPGAFKPPHRGHFQVVKSFFDGTHGGSVYDVSDVGSVPIEIPNDGTEKIEKIDKVVIFLGTQVRNGISLEDSKRVWEVYAKYLPGKIEFNTDRENPMRAAMRYVKDRPDTQFYLATGIRGEEDRKDLKRASAFKNQPNVKALATRANGPGVRATNFRKALLSGELDQVREFFPKELSDGEVRKLAAMLKQSIVAERMMREIDTVFESIKEGSSGTAIAGMGVLSNKDRAKLEQAYIGIKQLLNDDFQVQFNQDHIRVNLRGEALKTGFDYTPYMASILEYMMDKKMKVVPLPEIKIKRDLTESENLFGRTAYYDPNIKEVTLYVEGRHPKDVLRSFVHEMIHHIQNNEGRLGKIQTTNTNEDANLQEIEAEAYLLGNLTFRNWEDKVKNEKKKSG